MDYQPYFDDTMTRLMGNKPFVGDVQAKAREKAVKEYKKVIAKHTYPYVRQDDSFELGEPTGLGYKQKIKKYKKRLAKPSLTKKKAKHTIKKIYKIRTSRGKGYSAKYMKRIANPELRDKMMKYNGLEKMAKKLYRTHSGKAKYMKKKKTVGGAMSQKHFKYLAKATQQYTAALRALKARKYSKYRKHRVGGRMYELYSKGSGYSKAFLATTGPAYQEAKAQMKVLKKEIVAMHKSLKKAGEPIPKIPIIEVPTVKPTATIIKEVAENPETPQVMIEQAAIDPEKIQGPKPESQAKLIEKAIEKQIISEQATGAPLTALELAKATPLPESLDEFDETPKASGLLMARGMCSARGSAIDARAAGFLGALASIAGPLALEGAKWIGKKVGQKIRDRTARMNTPKNPPTNMQNTWLKAYNWAAKNIPQMLENPEVAKQYVPEFIQQHATKLLGGIPKPVTAVGKATLGELIASMAPIEHATEYKTHPELQVPAGEGAFGQAIRILSTARGKQHLSSKTRAHLPKLLKKLRRFHKSKTIRRKPKKTTRTKHTKKTGGEMLYGIAPTTTGAIYDTLKMSNSYATPGAVGPATADAYRYGGSMATAIYEMAKKT